MNNNLKKIVLPIWKALVIANPILMTKIKYYYVTHKKLDLKNPKTFNEKLQWLKLYRYYHNDLVTSCIDKYKVREFVKEKGCEEILIELFGAYNSADEIDWGILPNKFVIKCNHGCAYNIICTEKEKLDIEAAKIQINRWMKEKYGYTNVELLYSDIVPKIIIEKFIETEDGIPPKDYKIFCSYGVPKLLYVASDRFDGHVKFDYYTPEWKWIPVKNNHPNTGGKIPKPEFLDEMLNYASKLSKDFPMVRVDLYHEGGNTIFGELTFLHFGGSAPFDPPSYDEKFGELFELD